MAKVSVVIPAHNAARFVMNAIGSALAQSHSDLDVVVVDDGSTDGTGALLDGLARTEPRLSTIHQVNSGVSAARNRAMQEATGEFVAFLDADDLLLPDSIRSRHDFLTEHPEVGLVFGDYHCRDDAQTTRERVLTGGGFLPAFADTIERWESGGVIFGSRFLPRYLKFSPLPIWTGTVMIRHRILNRVGGFRESYRVCEDTAFWITIIRSCRIGYVDRPMAVYQRAFSELTRLQETYDLDQIHLFGDLYDQLSDKAARRTIRGRLAALHYSLGYFYRTQGRLWEAQRSLVKSLRYGPAQLRAYKTLLATVLRWSAAHGHRDSCSLGK